MRKTLKSIDYFVFLIIFLFCSCNFDRNEKIYPRLPVARNSIFENNGDSCCFSISIRDDLMMIADNDSSCIIKGFTQIDSFICHLIKFNKFKYSYPIVLKIDSLTSYTTVDKLIEKLQQIGFNKFYFKTSTNGFSLIFPEKDGLLQNEVVKLYGKEYSNKINILQQCSLNDNIKENVYDIDEPPPPPPPPPPSIIRLNYKSDDETNIDTSKISFVGFCDKYFVYNNKHITSEIFCKNIYNKFALYVDMKSENRYKDFIKVIDKIIEVKNKKLNYYSMKIFKRKFDNLNEEQQNEIKVEYGIRFLIRNIALQNYMNEEKQ